MMWTFLLGSLPDGSVHYGRPAAGEIIVLFASTEPDAVEQYRTKVRELKALPSAYKGFGILTVGPSDDCWRWRPLEEPEVE